MNHEPRESSSGALKFTVLALVVLAMLGGVAYWFLSTAPEPAIEPEAEPEPAVEAPAEPEVEEEAPAESEDVAAFGAIEVRANVEGASVYVDGELVGEAPYTGTDLPAGRHEVRVEKEGYEPFVRNIRVRGGAREELTASLDLLGASLRVASDVPGATVFLDRNYIGTTPVDIRDVEPGEHQLTVSADGYDMYAETIHVTTGHRDVNVSFKNVELQESLAVVHKHGFGSCEGTLIADNEGLRYETSNENDGFRVPFSQLEQFEVDYLDKNLNLKIRNGRNYNFTEKSGNADALFLFHKNVQEFRERS